MNDIFHRQASELVLHDLIDCLLAEQFFEQSQTALLSPRQFQEAFPGLPAECLIWQWTISSAPLHRVLLPVTRGFVQPLRHVPGTPVLEVQGSARSPLDPAGLMALVIAYADVDFTGRHKEGAALFQEWLDEAVRQTAWSQDHRVDAGGLLAATPAAAFQTLEQRSSLRDRPFHPVAKAKKGFTQDEYRRYMAEFGEPTVMRWMAIDKVALACGSGVDGTLPEHFLLDEAEQEALRREMEQRGIAHTHVALPVHPWQASHMLPRQLEASLAAGVCVPLNLEQGRFLPTSSVRSLAPVRASPHHLKLPVGIYSLGASRYLPAIKMINGQRSEALLRLALTRDAVLAQKAFLCDETKWWSYLPADATLFDEGPRHLSALVRSYPPALLDDPRCRLVPMAALGVPVAEHESHFFDEWMTDREMARSAHNALALFTEVCEVFMDVNLRLFRLGMLAEVHGQNAVLVWRDGQAAGVLLRDHDSLRIHVPWLERQGMADPQYQLRPGHANTLYHETPEELLFYLQTLAIQVNLRAIIEVVADGYGIAERDCWSALRGTLVQAIERIGFSDEARSLLHAQLFDAPRWPLKLLVRPMIERAAGPGSMPFGKSHTRNPFQRLPHPADALEDEAACIA